MQLQLLWDDAIKFTRWQHPAMGRGVWFVVSGTARSHLLCVCVSAACATEVFKLASR